MSFDGSSFRPSSIESIESTLDTGDLVWLSGPGPSKFLFKAGSWRMFSRVGVLLRAGPGLEGLQLCVAQACLQDAGDSRTLSNDEYITICSLSDELASGDYKQVAITKLAHPFSEGEKQAAFNFCNRAIGQQLNQKVPLCVNPSRKVFCNQLAADMLLSCGKVALVDNMYGPAKATAGQLLQIPVFVAIAHNKGQPPPRRKPLDASPVPSVASLKQGDMGANGGMEFRDVNDQQQMEVFYSVHSLPDDATSDMRGAGDNTPVPGNFGPLAAALANRNAHSPTKQSSPPALKLSDHPNRVVATVSA